MFRTRPPWPSPSQAIYGYLGNTRYFAGIASWTATWNECWEAKGPAFPPRLPYNCNYTQKKGGNKVTNDNLGPDFQAFLQSACERILAVTKGAVYICISSSEVHTLARAFKVAGGHWSTYIIWSKDRFTLGRSDYMRQFEIILYGWKEGGEHFWCGARNEGTFGACRNPSAIGFIQL